MYCITYFNSWSLLFLNRKILFNKQKSQNFVEILNKNYDYKRFNLFLEKNLLKSHCESNYGGYSITISDLGGKETNLHIPRELNYAPASILEVACAVESEIV